MSKLLLYTDGRGRTHASCSPVSNISSLFSPRTYYIYYVQHGPWIEQVSSSDTVKLRQPENDVYLPVDYNIIFLNNNKVNSARVFLRLYACVFVHVYYIIYCNTCGIVRCISRSFTAVGIHFCRHGAGGRCRWWTNNNNNNELKRTNRNMREWSISGDCGGVLWSVERVCFGYYTHTSARSRTHTRVYRYTPSGFNTCPGYG